MRPSSFSTAIQPHPYLWRNVIPACQGLGRLIACDLIGMGDSDKLPILAPIVTPTPSGEICCLPFGRSCKLGNNIILVLHDWGSALGFDGRISIAIAFRASPIWKLS